MNSEPECESSRGQSRPEAKLYLTIKELAELSGFSVPTLRRLKKQGRLVSVQPGGPGTKAVFRRNALEHGCVPASSPEIATEHAGRQARPREPVSRSGPKPAWQR